MKRFFVFSLSVFLLIGYSCVLFSMSNIDKLTCEDTIEYSASVTDVQITNVGKKNYIRIYIDNYFSYVLVSPRITSQIDIANFYNIEKNANIVFRIEEKKNNLINQVEFSDIVYLKIKDNVIFSLEDYNLYTTESIKIVRICGIILILVIATYLLYSLVTLHRKTDKGTVSVKTK